MHKVMERISTGTGIQHVGSDMVLKCCMDVHLFERQHSVSTASVVPWHRDEGVTKLAVMAQVRLLNMRMHSCLPLSADSASLSSAPINLTEARQILIQSYGAMD